MTAQNATVRRTTKETDVTLSLAFEPGPIVIDTGIGFFNHMLTLLAFHAGWSLSVTCKGDLDVDDHHSVEDTAIALGMAFAKLAPSGAGLVRFGAAYAPMDERSPELWLTFRVAITPYSRAASPQPRSACSRPATSRTSSRALRRTQV